MLQNQSFQEFPVSTIQRQYWLNHQLHSDGTAYNVTSVLHMRGALSESAVQRAFQAIIDRHENFRTTFSVRHGEPVQCISPTLEFKIEILDLQTTDQTSHVIEADRLIQRKVNEPFDIEHGPLLRASLIKTAQEEHFLVVVMHHSIVDLHTKNMFASELSAFYNAYLAGEDLQLPAPSFQYHHYSEYHNEWLKGAECQKMIASWKELVVDSENLLEFPIDKKRPAASSLQGNREFFEIPENATACLMELSRKEVVNIFALTLSAYAILLHKYSGQLKFAIGVPLTNRRNDDHKDIAGCFVNIIPIVLDFSGNPTVRDILGQVRKMMLAAHRNQEVPYEAIVRALVQSREAGFNPLFQAGFTYEPPMEVSFRNISAKPLKHQVQGSKLDQFMTMWNLDEKLQGYLEYSSDLFEESTVKRIVENYSALLVKFPDIIDRQVSAISVLSAAEREKIFTDWNSTDFPYPSEMCIHQMFERQVVATPNAEALVFQDGRLTYQQFNEKVNQLAHYLIKKGVRVEDKVGIFVERSAEMMIAIYAVLKAGGVYVPIDTNYPADRISYIVDNAKIELILTKKALSDIVNFPGVTRIALDENDEILAQESKENPGVSVNSKNLAYIIYTSGSTGRPKGVMIEHHSVINRLCWMQRSYPLNDNDVILQKTPITFDVSVWELFWWSFFGAKLCLLKPGGEKYPEVIIETIVQFRVTTLHFVPSMLNAFLEYINNGSTNLKLSMLKQVFASGEALPPATANKFNQLLYVSNRTRLINLYGPTEATVDVSYFNCDTGNPLDILPIGRPIDNIKLYIVDEQMNPVPVGVKGELLIAGVGVARGYYGNPELTQEKFPDNPFDPQFSPKLYRTGDMARFLADGNIEFLGRMDFQVKIRGFRIELGEIESVLRSDQMVKDAAVLAVENGAGDKRLVSYVVTNHSNPNAQSADNDLIRENLVKLMKMRLPEFMVPSEIIFMEAFPLTPNGKLNRKALPAPQFAHAPGQKHIVQAQSAIEKELADIWKSVLQKDAVGINENFFDIGGNSLLLIQVTARIQEKFNRKVEVFKLFEFPTIELFANYLGDNAIATEKTESIDIRMQKRKASLAQRGNNLRRN